MAALVQSFPAQQSSTPMSPRSQSPSGTIQAAAQGQSGHHSQHHNTPRYTSASGANSGSGYRGTYNTAPVAPYAFTSTPVLSNSKPSPQQTKPTERSSSTPTMARSDDPRQRYSNSTESSSSSSDTPLRTQGSQQQPARIADDSSVQASSRPNLRPLSTVMSHPPSLASPTSRPTPDRYRRGNRGSQSDIAAVAASGAGTTAGNGAYSQPNQTSSSPPVAGNGTAPTYAGVVKASFIGDYTGQLRGQSVDDIQAHRNSSQPSLANRRRSLGPGSMTTESFQTFLRQEIAATNGAKPRPVSVSPRDQSPVGKSGSGSPTFHPPVRPGSRRKGSTDSSSSRASSTKRDSITSATSNPPSNTSPTTSLNHDINPNHVPIRGSSADVAKRTTAPSPLSKPLDPEAPAAKDLAKGSPAAEQLAAISDGPKKGMKNRLRRAFSFGSAAELRKASAANSFRGEEAAERARLRQERYREEQEAEQARIAQRQEESGLGEGIYSGQGNFFTGSTDNISVSSTASSASIIMRKMGKGVKKSTRSLVGLFRPKSVTGVEAASGPIAQASTGGISMITVEAERERVNVNAHPAEAVAGGTGFPKLERNSIDMSARSGEIVSDGGSIDSRGRRSIVGGEKERAEVLAAVKKGILKRSGSSSPVAKPVDNLPVNFHLPQIPSVTGTTSENQRPSSGRTNSMKVEGEDYFMAAPRFPINGTHSAPSSPNSMSRYNVSFSPRITFHDTWPSGEYDRRGEIATCNRLTPMLAQQIKEELNTFKMEMDVHEESKIYTHFF